MKGKIHFSKIKIPIEKHVPISIIKKYRPRVYYPFESMEIGDSFFTKDGMTKVISAAVSKAQRRVHMRFTTRAVDGGVRVWRTK